MFRFALGALGALTLFGCAQQQTPMTWKKVDGQLTNYQQFELDKAACEGEVQKANLGGHPGYCGGIGGCAIAASIRGNQLGEVRKGCMASKGYLLVPDPNQPAPAVTAAVPASTAQ